MAHQKMMRGVIGKAGVVGHGDGGRINHDQAPQDQGGHHPQERLVDARDMNRSGAGAAEFGAFDAHRQLVGADLGGASAPAGPPVADGAHATPLAVAMSRTA